MGPRPTSAPRLPLAPASLAAAAVNASSLFHRVAGEWRLLAIARIW